MVIFGVWAWRKNLIGPIVSFWVFAPLKMGEVYQKPRPAYETSIYTTDIHNNFPCLRLGD